MSILKIARLGHPVLREIAEPIEPREIRGPEVQRLIRDMFETMAEYNGVGLAAPQVHVSKRLVLVGGGEDEAGEPLVRVLINPEVRATTTELAGMWEGCLSIPGLRGFVERPRAVEVKAYDDQGRKLQFTLEGFPAVVMQHECDHLDGMLFTDRLKDSRLLAFEDEAGRFLSAFDGADDDDDDDDKDGHEEEGEA
ncbi:MAG: peptide deformylase [Candidatus Krumholzibacteriia bacterium]